jgi:hypothetical protein
MFKRWYLIVWTVFITASIIVLAVMLMVQKEDYQQYAELIANSEPQEDAVKEYTGEQKRQGVVKDIWYVEESKEVRLHFRIVSAESELIFENKNGESNIIEKMNNVRCYMQERLYYLLPDGNEVVPSKVGKWYIIGKDHDDPGSWIEPSSETHLRPMQQIRYIEAEEALYYYNSDTFLAEKVRLSRYIVPGHQLIESVKIYDPLMRGVAQKVEFSLKGKDLNFKARHFKAVFYSVGKKLL